jgi:ABC-type uncharacterized transport system substrate-binding protein
MTLDLQRRSFLTLLGGAAAVWPVVARAQQQDGRVRRVGVLLGGAENDPRTQVYLVALRDTLTKLGWIDGGNMRIELRWGANDIGRLRAHAAELVKLAPDVIATSGGAATRTVQQATQIIPIVFGGGGDPVANGFVRNIARPEGNITGFPFTEPAIAGKNLELLKEVAPHLIRVLVIFDPDLLGEVGPRYVSSIEAAAPKLGVQISTTPVRTPLEIVRAVDTFAAEPNGGLLVLPPPPARVNRDLIIQLAAQHRLPTSFVIRSEVVAGGLIAYGGEDAAVFRGAATYVDRLLRGAKVADLPVQFPIKFELVVNLKAAKAIGLTIPESFLLRADEVIE